MLPKSYPIFQPIFHPVLAPFIITTVDGYIRCPLCSDLMRSTHNVMKSVHWVECLCEQQVTIYKNAGEEEYGELEINLALNKEESILLDFKLNLDFYKQKLRLVYMNNQEVLNMELPKFESLELNYLIKKIKFYLVFS